MRGVFWIDGEPKANLAMVLRPKGGKWLQHEMASIRRRGVQGLVSLLEEDEAARLGLANERAAAEHAGLQFLSFPIPDTHVPPDRADFREFVSGLGERLRSGQAIGVHCRGCIGRSTVTAACILMHLGWRAKVALAAIEKARGCPVPDTEEQRAWILAYETQL